MKQKIDTFIQENKLMVLNKDQTESYHRQLQQNMQRFENLIEKNRRKYLLNIKLTAPRINAYIKRTKKINQSDL